MASGDMDNGLMGVKLPSRTTMPRLLGGAATTDAAAMSPRRASLRVDGLLAAGARQLKQVLGLASLQRAL